MLVFHLVTGEGAVLSRLVVVLWVGIYLAMLLATIEALMNAELVVVVIVEGLVKQHMSWYSTQHPGLHHLSSMEAVVAKASSAQLFSLKLFCHDFRNNTCKIGKQKSEIELTSY